MVDTKNGMTTSPQVSAWGQNYQICHKLKVTNIRKLVSVLKVAKYMLSYPIQYFLLFFNILIILKKIYYAVKFGKKYTINTTIVICWFSFVFFRLASYHFILIGRRNLNRC